jgi:putative transcriptional regulator
MAEKISESNEIQRPAFELFGSELAKHMASEIVLSEKPWEEIHKWRLYCKMSQKKLAGKMGITSSVISDYESGRRKSPGIAMIKKIIIALTGYKPVEVKE